MNCSLEVLLSVLQKINLYKYIKHLIFIFGFSSWPALTQTLRLHSRHQNKGKKFDGIAVALSPFLAMLSDHGLDTLTSQDRIKQDIKNHGLGLTTNVKQVFNAKDDGSTISRSKESEDDTILKKYCVFVKRTAFAPEAWEEFATCNKYYYSVSTFL